MPECNFCKKEVSKLECSHILPKFIYNWLKKSSTTKKIRYSKQPNIPAQDGLKIPFLCKECELLFSECEKYFSENLFSLITNYDSGIPLEIKNEDLIKKFCISIFWRTLSYSYKENICDEFELEEIELIPDILNNLKDMYYDMSNNIYKYYIIPLKDKIIENKIVSGGNYSFYERSIGFEPRIWDNFERFILYIKVPFLALICELIPNNNDHWSGCCVNEEEYFFDIDNIRVPEYVSILFDHFSSSLETSRSKISENQKRKIEENVLKNISPSDGTYRTMIKDLKKKSP